MWLFGCGATRYNLEFDRNGFKSKKTSYAEGEEVKVTYDMVATDTDYKFYTDSEDVILDQEYDGSHGYVFTFTMPAHDVKLCVESHNNMMIDPNANNHKTAEGKSQQDVNAETWICPECGTKNEGKYCCECGMERPD